MAVIVELSLPGDQFELGRILTMEDETIITLETMIPMGERPIPFFRVYNDPQHVFEDRIRKHPSVKNITTVNTHDDEALYALDWQESDDTFIGGIRMVDGHLLEATGDPETWGFEIRFPTHDAVSTFQEYCHETDIPLDIKRIFNPTKPDAGPWYGLTASQREMLIRATESGYYSIPRQTSTKSLAEEFEISDQAVTERLRRGISTLVTNTILLTGEQD